MIIFLYKNGVCHVHFSNLMKLGKCSLAERELFTVSSVSCSARNVGLANQKRAGTHDPLHSASEIGSLKNCAKG